MIFNPKTQTFSRLQGAKGPQGEGGDTWVHLCTVVVWFSRCGPLWLLVMSLFKAAREYQRAVNAAKLDRVFAKPFLGALSGHSDGVSDLDLDPKRLSILASASFDGEVRLWDLSTRKCVVNYKGHPNSYARGLTFDPKGQHLYSVGDDKHVRIWDVQNDFDGEHKEETDSILVKGKKI